jgi:hypothetical protein
MGDTKDKTAYGTLREPLWREALPIVERFNNACGTALEATELLGLVYELLKARWPNSSSLRPPCI